MKIWCGSTKQCVYTHPQPYAQISCGKDDTDQGFVGLQVVDSLQTLFLTTIDHTIVQFDLDDLSVMKEVSEICM